MDKKDIDMQQRNEEYLRGKETIDFLTRLHHPVDSKYMDSSCPHIEWMGYDLNQCPGIGDWKCMLRQYKSPGEYGSYDIDYLECNCNDHSKCSFYINQNNAKDTAEKKQQ